MALTTQELSDREEIRETIMRWSRAVDTSDWTLFDKAYTDDIQADFASLGIPAMPVKELRAMLQNSVNFFDVQHHVLSNITYHEVTANTAKTSTLVTARSIFKNGDKLDTLAWYHDEFRRTSDGWRISKRTCQKIWDNNPQKDFTPPGLKK